MLQRLSRVKREGESEFTGRWCETLQVPVTGDTAGLHMEAISQATAALGSAMIEGAAETLLLSPSTLGSHKMNSISGERRLSGLEAAETAIPIQRIFLRIHPDQEQCPWCDHCRKIKTIYLLSAGTWETRESCPGETAHHMSSSRNTYPTARR